MRYFAQPKELYVRLYGKDVNSSHTLIRSGTLFQQGALGLLVVQNRFDEESKSFYYGAIDGWLCNEIYLNERFADAFKKFAGPCVNGNYPVIKLRKLMWALRMKPLKKEYFEEDF